MKSSQAPTMMTGGHLNPFHMVASDVYSVAYRRNKLPLCISVTLAHLQPPRYCKSSKSPPAPVALQLSICPDFPHRRTQTLTFIRWGRSPILSQIPSKVIINDPMKCPWFLCFTQVIVLILCDDRLRGYREVGNRKNSGLVVGVRHL